MRTLSILLLVCVLSACASPTAVPALPTSVPPTPTIASQPLTGEWLGGVTKPDGSIASLSLNFDDANLTIEPLTATWSMAVTQNGEQVTFSASGKSKDPFTQIDFAGTFSNGGFAGELSWDDQKSSLTFTPIASVDSAVLDKYEGVYRFESGRALSIIVSPEYSSGGLRFFSQTLMMTDFESGALRGLYPLDKLTFAVGALRVVGAPFSGRLQFIVDDQGSATGLMWWDEVNGVAPSSASGQFAKRVEYQQEDVTFTSADGVKLAGRVSLPESNVPVPAFMMLHGSEPGTRDNFGAKQMAHYMISQGFAILNYDKRGVGGSEGFYQEAASESNLKKHADDAVAGAEFLASRPEIDAKRIGLIGGSQAGWVIPLAAAQSERISYFVILSGPVASTAQEDRFSTYTNDGESALSNYDDAKITQQIREMRSIGFDPVPVIVGLTQPGVWLWGGVDKNIPVTFSAENLQAVIDSGKSNFSYQIFPNADHGLNITPNGLFAELPYSPGVAFYPALTAWLKLNMLVGSVKVSEKDGMKLFYVPAGEFTMGSDNGDDNEKPVHVVLMDAFWIDQTEITNDMYALCVKDGACDAPGSKESLTRPTYYGEAEYNSYPVIFVDWNRAKTYCQWAGRRLPTEAEWEKAARGTESFVYPWGNAMPDKYLLNYNDFIGDTTEVGIYPNGASPYGALDMAGNVWEWVNDWFAPDYYQNSAVSNPLGPSTGRTHVLRGGSWNLNEALVRSTYRGTHPSEPNLAIGFRCAMDANP